MGTTEKIITAVYAAMQAAEEIGGPEGEEYIDLMEQISREAGERAIRARKITPALVMPEDFDFASTGGGCTAWQKMLGEQSQFVMVTVADDAMAPSAGTEQVAVGVYGGEDAGEWVVFTGMTAAEFVAVWEGDNGDEILAEFVRVSGKLGELGGQFDVSRLSALLGATFVQFN